MGSVVGEEQEVVGPAQMPGLQAAGAAVAFGVTCEQHAPTLPAQLKVAAALVALARGAPDQGRAQGSFASTQI